MANILVADDRSDNLYLLDALIKGFGHKVVLAQNGEEAFKLAKQNKPDLIISDVLMPVMDGFTLCIKWKKDDELKNIPFVFYTATYTEEKDRQFALSLGCDRFITKPQEPVSFIEEINKVLKGHKELNLANHKKNYNEKTMLREYNEVLFNKLEDKIDQLEKKNHILRLKEKELFKTRDKLKLFNEHLQFLRERERILLTRRLHDDLAQMLNALKIDLDVLNNTIKKSKANISKNRLNKEVGKIINLAESSISSLRASIKLISPPMIEEFGFETVLEDHINDFRLSTGIKTKFGYDGKLNSLDSNLCLNVYRILQQLLSNIEMHSKAKTAEISLKIIRDYLEIEIIDNGKGYSTKELEGKPSFGIMEVKERVSKFSGEVSIDSKKNKGTKVSIRLPIIF